MLAILDYGMGNLRSVQRSLERMGHAPQLIRTPDEIRKSDRLIVPGVGAFRDAITTLRERGLDAAIVDHVKSGKPTLGICLGLQLLFDRSFEGGEFTGLGLLAGEVRKFEVLPTDGLKVPHMGWNTLEPGPAAFPLVATFNPPPAYYFVHSYYAVPADESIVSGWCEYGGRFCAAVHKDNLMAAQFHPEKSQAAGLDMLHRFANWSA